MRKLIIFFKKWLHCLGMKNKWKKQALMELKIRYVEQKQKWSIMRKMHKNCWWVLIKICKSKLKMNKDRRSCFNNMKD